jgi:predicted regulator of amino acid metabolism with ACT domain
MPSRVIWMVPAKVIRLQLLDFVTSEEIIAHMHEIERRVNDSFPSTVHVIVDFRTLTCLPTNIRFLADVSRPLAALPNVGNIVILGPKSPLIQTLATVVSQIVRFRYRVAQTISEAVEYLNHIDPELQLAK